MSSSVYVRERCAEQRLEALSEASAGVCVGHGGPGTGIRGGEKQMICGRHGMWMC